MKRSISLLLAVLILMSSFAFAVSASDGGYGQVYTVTLPEENNKFIIAPCDGYDIYVNAGEAFEFYIEPKKGYSLKSATVTVDGVILFGTEFLDEYFQPHPTRRTYKIDAVTSHTEVAVTMVMEESQTNLFEWLITFISKIVAFFQKIFGVATE